MDTRGETDGIPAQVSRVAEMAGVVVGDGLVGSVDGCSEGSGEDGTGAIEGEELARGVRVGTSGADSAGAAVAK